MKFISKLSLKTVLSSILMVGTLSACTSSGTGDALQSAANTKPSANENNDLRAFCPKIVLRAGTETLRTYAKGVKKNDENAAEKLKYQATISETVRECNYISDTLSMRVGVAGRIITGPVGGPGTTELPIRVAITKGDGVLYSKLHKISVTIEPGKTIAKFRFVDENLVIDKPAKNNIIIYVGFDEGPTKKK